ncbi:hypothetical protein L249_7079 [Ophiocordyceps polyrhachis-furcata BCC 54312]|uniref:Uncharacterized protein n=1 Tax=Ophiocordyceps polyrhachis-furcata BCC 54312 TaxID=1330021 RepID=A0A367LK37_9HYPO|nr:hypothetical protein L249_7079 [Ophiocordyceps polyrhachis-furcata BCC 54312]
MHDLGLRAQSPLNVGKVESNEVFCRAVEEEEGSKKLVESLLFAAVEMMMSNQGVDYVIEKKKTNYVIVVFNKVEADNKLEVGTSKGDLEEDFNVGRYDRYWYSASIAYSAPIDVQRADRCDDRCNESIGRYDRYSPTVTQGVWPYRLISYPFKMKKYALYSS